MKIHPVAVRAALAVGAALHFGAARPCWPQASPQYVNSEKCKDCHDAQWTHFQTNIHALVEKDPKLVGVIVGCESCHGPGSAHVQAGGEKSDPGFATIRAFTKMTPSEANAICQKCHQGSEQMHWTQSDHARADLTCVQCHSIHAAKSPGEKMLLRADNTSKLCLGCHQDKQLAMARTAHMPLREGGMTCADCHNPHGTTTAHNLRAQTTNELCLSCHTDKRGPFLFEHAPVRENCLNCHDPHGSNNAQVLAAKLPFLCQRCHVGTRHPSTLYDAPDLALNRLFNRSCVNCHSQIHGSNHPSGQRFLR